MDDVRPLCRRVRENLAAYLDGELKGGARRVIEEHLTDCPDCRRYLEELKETWRLLDELETPIVRRKLTDRVWTRIDRDRKVGRLERATGARGALSGLAAALAAAVFLFGLYISSRPLSDVPTAAENECIMYLDVLRDLETLDNMEMVRYIQQLDQTIGQPAESDGSEDSSG